MVTLTRRSPDCGDTADFAAIFLLTAQDVTGAENIHNWLHLGSFACVLPLAKRMATRHNQDPRGIDW